MWQFITGIMIGSLFGFFLMGLCVASSDADRASERYWNDVSEEKEDM